MAGRLLGGLVDSYLDAGGDEPGVVIGSTGRLEIFVKLGSAQTRLGAGRGTPVRVRRPE
jgi:S-adenosylmethionine hydrolase